MGFKTTLTIKHIDGWSFKLDVNRDADILGIKVMIWEIQMVPLSTQRLVFDGKELNDNTKLTDVGIVDGDTIFLIETKREEKQVKVATVETIQLQLPATATATSRPTCNNYAHLDGECVENSEWKIRSVVKLSCWIGAYFWLGLLIALLSTLACWFSVIPFLVYLLGLIGARKLCKCLLIFPMVLTAIIGFGGLMANIIWFYDIWQLMSIALCVMHIVIFACIAKLVCKISKLNKTQHNEARNRIRGSCCCC